jgi:hypothetical protein
MRTLQEFPPVSDKLLVRRFADNAVRIFEAAESAFQAGLQPEETTILIGREGQLRVIQHSDWSLGRLQEEYGAAMAYRVLPEAGKIRLEARSDGRQMLLESDPANTASRKLLGKPVADSPLVPQQVDPDSKRSQQFTPRLLEPAQGALVLLRASESARIAAHVPRTELPNRYEFDEFRPRLLEENEPILPEAWG